jgi:hypothetical protein
MKRLLVILALLTLLAIATFPLKGAANPGRQMAITTFTQPVHVQGHILKGEYLFVHDDAAMQRGEACTYIYKGNAPLREKLVVSFHCLPTARTKAFYFVVRTEEKTPGMIELNEFQFAGDSEAHVVPAN